LVNKKGESIKIVHEYIYQRAKSNKFDIFGDKKIVLLVNLYQETKITSDANVYIDYQTKDVRSVFLDFPISDVPEQYQYLLEMDEVMNDTIALDVEEFTRLADEKKTDEHAFITYRLKDVNKVF